MKDFACIVLIGMGMYGLYIGIQYSGWVLTIGLIAVF